MSPVAASDRGAFPFGAVVVHVLGALLLGVGCVGLFAPEILSAVPALTDRTTALTLLGAGVALDVGAAIVIVGHLRARRPSAPR